VRQPPIWAKAFATSDYLFYDLATQPQLLGLVRTLLGEDVILWGAFVQSREVGEVHPWHTDIETSDPDVRSVSIWIGIENTSRESALQVIRGSHRLGRTIQEVAQSHGFRRGEATSEAVEAWARAIDPEACFIQPDMTDGEAIAFDGRLWHGTENKRTTGRRTALLLQYAAASQSVNQPDFSQLEWPFRYKRERPPVIAVSGAVRKDRNSVVGPPAIRSRKTATEILHTFDELPKGDPTTGWKPHHIFHGSTRSLDFLTVHASVLSPGHSPHPPHAHPEEEILIVLDGVADCVISADSDEHAPRVEVLGRGELVYYPAYQYHTIRNTTQRPITYLMMKWCGPVSTGETCFEPAIVRAAATDWDAGESSTQHRLCEFPTSYLAKLHAHQSVLLPADGYDPHMDEYDVAILVLSGQIESLGRVFGPNSFLMHSAGEPHGIRNVGTEPARYLVFEFHTPRYRGCARELPQLAAVPRTPETEWEIVAQGIAPLAGGLGRDCEVIDASVGTIHVVTPDQPWAYGAQLGLPKLDGKGLDFVLEITVTVTKGELGLGLLNSSGTDFIHRQKLCSDGKTRVVQFTIPDLHEIGSIVAHTWDAPKTATATIHSVRLMK
jgi:mannose-6-phosphate isomerase-like protein (cupin superfamily)